MKRTLITCAALLALTGGTNAADIYKGSTKDAPIVEVPVQSWTGFYFGGSAGGAWSQLDSSFTDSGTFGKTPWDLTINHTNAAAGFAGGGQLGYNWQTGALLLGIETDFGYLGISKTRDILAASVGSVGGAVGTKVDSGFLADVTGRIGWTSGPALFYAKGGWAYLDETAGTSGISALAALAHTTSIGDASKSGFNGWTVGGGIEYLISPNWSLKAEYQHFNFGSFDLQPITVATTVPSISNTLTVDTVKVGLNYHFSGYTALK